MLFTAVYLFGDHRLCGFTKQILLGIKTRPAIPHI
jgi:hypothetical protein